MARKGNMSANDDIRVEDLIAKKDAEYPEDPHAMYATTPRTQSLLYDRSRGLRVRPDSGALQLGG